MRRDGAVCSHMAIITRQTHRQVGGEVCETATLSDGRVLRVIGHEHYRSVTAELRGWLLWLGLAILLVGCGGAEFSPGVEQVVDSSPAEASAPADAGSRGEGAANADGGEMEATTDCCSNPTMACKGGCADAAPKECDDAGLVTHSDGIGQTWQDCAPLGTYDVAEAQAACKANAAPCVMHVCTGSDLAVCNLDPDVPGYCTCWTYAGTDVGHVNSQACTDLAHAYCGGGTPWE